MSSSYNDFNYEIEKQISVEDHKPLKDWSLKGFYFYVLFNHDHKFRIVYATRYKYPNGKKFLGKQLNFLPLTFYKFYDEEKKRDIMKPHRIRFSTLKGNFGEEYVDFLQHETEGSSFAGLFQKIKQKSDGSIEVKNIHNIHVKKVAVDKPNWFIDEIKKKNIKNLQKKVIKDLLQDTQTDDRLLKLIKTEFFEHSGNEHMHINPHAIVLTQGGTGKSSILGVNGLVKEKNSDAGVFGYYNVSGNAWVSGAVSQTNRCIVMDEINQIINSTVSKGEDFMTSINSALENGTYSYGKAGGRQISFGNQFIFCANISQEFTFESFVNGIASNVETIGRRFSYIIYDHNLKFVKGNKIRPKVRPEICEILSAYLTYLWDYFVYKRNFVDKTFNKKTIKSIEKDYIRKIKQLLSTIDLEGRPACRKFFDSYLGTSLGSRLKNMAFKIALFDNLNYFLENENLNSSNHSIVYGSFIKNYKDLLEDMLITIKNICQDFEFSPQSDFQEFHIKRQFNNLSKSEKNILEKLSEHYELFDNNKLNYKSLSNIGSIKHIVSKWKQGIGIKKNYKNLNCFGVIPTNIRGEIYFTLTNKSKFEEMRTHIFNDKSEIDMTNNTISEKSALDEIEEDLH